MRANPAWQSIRRLFAAVAAVAAWSLCASAHAAVARDDAAAYPTKPIRLLVGFPPGGGNDALARTIGPRLVPVLAHIKGGRLRPVAVTSLNRSRLLPELPTINDAGVPGYEFVSWYGILAPAATPRPIIAKLNKALNDVTRQAEVTERAHAEDMDVIDSTPAQFDQVRRAMVTKWDKIIKATGIEAN